MTPKIGDIVHYKHNPGVGGPSCRPAIIVRCWGTGPGTTVQLQVFNDSDAAGIHNDAVPPMEWRTSIDQGFANNQFHYRNDCLDNY